MRSSTATNGPTVGMSAKASPRMTASHAPGVCSAFVSMNGYSLPEGKCEAVLKPESAGGGFRSAADGGAHPLEGRVLVSERQDRQADHFRCRLGCHRRVPGIPAGSAELAGQLRVVHVHHHASCVHCLHERIPVG